MAGLALPSEISLPDDKTKDPNEAKRPSKGGVNNTAKFIDEIIAGSKTDYRYLNVAQAYRESNIRQFNEDGTVLLGGSNDAGIFQLTPIAVKDLNQRTDINYSYKDICEDPVKNIEAALAFKKLYRGELRTNGIDSELAVIAAFKVGVGGIFDAAKRAKSQDFESFRARLTNSAQQYVRDVYLLSKMIEEDHKKGSLDTDIESFYNNYASLRMRSWKQFDTAFRPAGGWQSTYTSLPENIKKIVIIDAGHKGKADPGAVYKDTRESDLNLDTTSVLGHYLKKNGCHVVYTRTKADQNVSMTQREKLVKDWVSEYGPDNIISVSIHADAGKGYGHTIYVDDQGIRSQSSKKLAGFIFDGLNASRVSAGYKISERGIRDDSLSSKKRLRMTQLPVDCILVEVGFGDNPNDLPYVTSDAPGKALGVSVLRYISKN